MPADTLIFKRRNRENIVKITPSMKNGQGHEKCEIHVNMYNYKDLALFFEDLRSMWNIPIDKAIEEYKKNNADNAWPF
jgi:hypothetical protein